MRHQWTLLVTALVLAQPGESPAGEDPYLGQTPPGMIAEVFARGIVSTPDHEHSRVEFARDGRMLLWSVMPVPLGSGRQSLRFAELTEEGWTDPAPPPFLDNPNCGSPTFSAAGEAFYFIARAPRPAGDESPRRQQVWRVRRQGEGWSEPHVVENVLPVIPGKVTMAFCFAANGNLYCDVGGPDPDDPEEGAWSWSLYVRKFKGGEYLPPEELAGGINAGLINWCPFIAPDESYLIYSSDRTGGQDQGDLYISFRDPAGRWSEPVNLGPAVNTEAQERFPSVSPEGKYLFFARNMPKTHSDIFWVDAKVIEELKE